MTRRLFQSFTGLQSRPSMTALVSFLRGHGVWP